MNPKQYKFQQELLEKLKQGSNPMDEKTLNEILKNARESKYDYAQPLLNENDMKIIDEIDKRYGTGKYRNENKTNILSRLTSNMSNDTKAWVLSVTGISTVAALIYVIAHYETTLWVILTMCGLGMFYGLAYAVKQLIKIEVFDDYE